MTALVLTHGLPQLKELTQLALAEALRLGASAAEAQVSEDAGLSVSVRRGEIETVEQSREHSMSISVYLGKRCGSASTTDFSAQAIRATVAAAVSIGRHTAEDPAGGLPDPDTLALGDDIQELGLFRPWEIDAQEAVALALRAEAAAFDVSPRITNTDGTSVAAQHGQFVLSNTEGFSAGYPYSRHWLSVAPIAGEGDAMQRDDWYSASRDPARLAAPEAIGRYAAQRTLSRLDARRIPTQRCPVLFEAPLACGLLGALAHAASGGAIYRGTSFLAGALDQPLFAPHLDVIDDPFIPGAMGSAPFDGEGVLPMRRTVVEAGVLRGYFLSTYSARKLGMRTTGNAGGSHNLRLQSRADQSDDLAGMLRRMGRGLLVTELIGQGVNYLTGDYSRGAFGYWVEGGQIQYPVQEITIASNLRDMFAGIVAVGGDVLTRGSKTTGSVLIDSMAIAGD